MFDPQLAIAALNYPDIHDSAFAMDALRDRFPALSFVFNRIDDLTDENRELRETDADEVVDAQSAMERLNDHLREVHDRLRGLDEQVGEIAAFLDCRADTPEGTVDTLDRLSEEIERISNYALEAQE